MARWRAIHPKISQSLDVEALSEWAQLLWDRIIANGDDFGRMRGEAALVKALCKPLSPRPVEEFEAALREIEAAGLVRRYAVGRQTYLQVGKWDEFQGAAGIHKRTKSDFPAPPQDVSGNVPGSLPEGSGQFPPRALTRPDQTKPDETGEGPGEPSVGPSADAEGAPSVPAVPPPPAGLSRDEQIAEIQRVADACRAVEDAAAPLHQTLMQALWRQGYTCEPEHSVPDRGDGTPGRIDVYATKANALPVAIEIDRAAPRDKSVFKLRQVEGLRGVILRRAWSDPIPDGLDFVIGLGLYEPEAPTPVPPPPPADPLLPALARLRALAGYQAREDDLTWLADRARLFGAADALEREIAKCADHWTDKDAKSLNVVKPKWRSRLSKWLDNASKFAAERSGRVVDLRVAQPRARNPDAGWLDTDERRREVGLA